MGGSLNISRRNRQLIRWYTYQTVKEHSLESSWRNGVGRGGSKVCILNPKRGFRVLKRALKLQMNDGLIEILNRVVFPKIWMPDPLLHDQKLASCSFFRSHYSFSDKVIWNLLGQSRLLLGRPFPTKSKPLITINVKSMPFLIFDFYVGLWRNL